MLCDDLKNDQNYWNNVLKLNFRPIYIAPDGHIFLEAYSSVYQHARDFLIGIAEPICRPENVHEFKLTPYSLYAAVSVGLETNEIIEYLRRLSKTSIPEDIIEFIRLCTLSYGKVKLLLKENRYFIESSHIEVIQKLLNDPVIQSCKISEAEETTFEAQQGLQYVKPIHGDDGRLADGGVAPEYRKDQTETAENGGEVVPEDIGDFYDQLDKGLSFYYIITEIYDILKISTYSCRKIIYSKYP